MKKIFFTRIVSLALLAGAILAVYFINVEVQSYFGRQALAKAGLTNLPLEPALTKAKAENKLLLVDVSAIWCPTCRKLDNTVFADAVVRQTIGEKFIFSRLEYESPEGEAFLATLSRLASSLADLKNARAFGTCLDCTHYTPADDGGFCACMAAELGADEIDKLCGSYHSPAGSTPRIQTAPRLQAVRTDQ